MPTNSRFIINGEDFTKQIKSIAHREWVKSGRVIDYEEAESAALFGLATCMERFDSSRNVSLAGYAGSRIRGSVKDDIGKVCSHKDDLLLYEDIGFDSYEAPSGENVELGIQRREIVQQVCGIIVHCLTTVQRHIIRRFYMDEVNVRQIAKELGMSMSMVSVHKREALAEIQRQMLWRNGGRGLLPWS